MSLIPKDIIDQTDYDFQDIIKENYFDIENPNMFSNLIEAQLEFDEKYAKELREYYSVITEATAAPARLTKFSKSVSMAINDYLKYNNNQVHKYIIGFRKKIAEDNLELKPYISKLKNYNGENIASDIVRYNYSHIFEDPMPSPKALDDYINVRMEIDKAIGKDKSMTNYQRLKLLKTEYQKLIDYIKSGDCYSSERAKLLGRSDNINAENFQEEIYKCFRSENVEVLGPITPKDVKDALDRFSKYDQLLKTLDIEKNDVWRQYNYIIENINKIEVDYTKDWFLPDREEFDKFYNMYIKLKTDQIIRLSHLHNQVYFAKMDIIIKSYIQDRDILSKACGYINASQKGTTGETFDLEEYAMFLIEEQYNSIEIYLEMMRANGIDTIQINESTIISLNEAAFDTLKNYLINICKKLSDVMDRFMNKVIEIAGIDEKFLKDNQNKILSNTQIKNEVTFKNYFSYRDLIKKLNTVKFSSITSDEIEAKAANGQWQTPEDYLTQEGSNVTGFAYVKGGDPFKVQLENYLRGNKSDISSKALNARMRSNLLGYCVNDFPAIKKMVEFNKESLKAFSKAMDQYLATVKSNTQQAPEVNQNQEENTQPAQQESYTLEDTINTYLNEVEIEKQNQGPNDPTPNNIAKANQNKTQDKNKAISNAVKSFTKVNIQKCSALMNISIEAYRQCMKMLRWYVTELNKQNNENKQNAENKSIADAVK